jgi:hypothetical protein
VCILKTPPWKKERAAILCIKSEKVAAVCLALKRHLGPLPADIFWTGLWRADLYLCSKKLAAACLNFGPRHGASFFNDLTSAYSTVQLTFHPLHGLSSGYFEKLRAFCTQRTHFGPLPADCRVHLTGLWRMSFHPQHWLTSPRTGGRGNISVCVQNLIHVHTVPPNSHILTKVHIFWIGIQQRENWIHEFRLYA